VANPYPVDLASTDGTVRQSGRLTFTDPANQPGGGSQTLRASTPIVLTDAQIRSLPTTTTPELLVAPGAGKVALPVSVAFVTDFAANYTGVDADGSYVGVFWDDGADVAQWGDLIQNAVGGFTTHLTDLTQLLAPSSSRALLQLPVAYRANTDSNGVASVLAPTRDLAVMEDKHLILFCGNGADFTGGNPANTLTITVYYVLLDV
jgi:hypothetical protein